jgi:TAT (twin-arginine translocation) pathway signal sequence.
MGKWQMKQAKSKQMVDSARREFLRGSAMAGASMALMAMVPGQAAAADQEQEQTTGKGYRLTSHILAYYQSAAS